VKSSSDNITVDKNTSWLLSHHKLSHLDQGVIETLFSLGNGTLGTRGTSGYEGTHIQVISEGTYINGAYFREPITYDEPAYGYAQFNNKMLQVSNTKTIKISTDYEDFEIIELCEKSLDLQSACYHEVLLLATKSGKQIKLFIERIVCQHYQDLILNNYRI